MESNLALDSGAFSLFMKYAKRGAIESSDFSFYSSEKFYDYLDKFVARVKANPYRLDWYVTVDALYNPELSYDIWKELRQEGISPMPVVHYGEDLKWLRMYMDEVEYIGLGGMGTRQSSVEDYTKWVSGAFKLLRGKNGKPTHRIHGFALTQYDVLCRYPWHSVDSTTCWRAASNGSFMMPGVTAKGEVDHTSRPYWFPCTPGRSDNASNVWKLGETYLTTINQYLAQFGYTLEDARDNYMVRNIVSYNYFHKLCEHLTQLRDYPFHFYASGRPAGCSNEALLDLVRLLRDKIKVSQFDYLGTFFDIKTMDILNTHLEAEHENQKRSPRIKTRKPGPSHEGLHPDPDTLLSGRRPVIRVRR